ncbi:hypothetical protein LIER_36273 [Lithospermum erythrorhizon]|uniref:CRC domain-containing protein n=1 Tax=Lithospermum erythrorhizon TaxID=34254 RepID=A0AAV3P4P2_LITER
MQGGQVHVGMRRRCLHFYVVQQKNTTNGSDLRNAFGNEGVSSSAVPTAELGHINLSSLEPVPPCYKQLPTLALPQTIGKPIVKRTKPSGFGLHLNSIINSVQCGTTISMKSMGSGSFSIRGKSSSIIRIHSFESSRSCLLSCNEANQFLAKINTDRTRRDQAVAVASEAVSFSYCSKLGEVEASKPLEPIPCDKRKYSTSNSIIEELSQSSPKKRRFKNLDDGGDGCKRCNCKKTKCLKLYCDCFAAGIYCAEPCACQGCFNRPEYEDIVIDTRKQIESRNPHAFAPKITQHATEASTKTSTNEEVLSSSARHKRGCNCKKSMCLKKYCECYQANVGCSDGCRCDGCQNVFGRKEEYVENKHLRKQGISEPCDVSSGGELQEVASTNDTLCTQQFSPHDLTPQTPSFQYSDHEKDRSKSWLPSGEYLPSPESATIADSYLISPGSSGHISNHGIGIIQAINKDILDLVPFHQELDDGNLINADKFSPRYHLRGSIYNHPSALGPHDWATRMGSQPISENSNFSSGSSLHMSPISSMTSFEENKYLGAMDSDSGLCEGIEDDTPDILKDNDTQLNSVKVCSPNMKRVSPPHAIVQEPCSSSSAGLKTCRKFILKSVPSFPPLTPVDSKDENPKPRRS